MKVETMVDATRAAQLVSDLRGVSRAAEPALEADELQTLSEVAEFLEETACIETGECYQESPITEKTYRVTRWIDAGDGQVVALAKEEVDREEVEA
jgi:hypothetical protein